MLLLLLSDPTAVDISKETIDEICISQFEIINKLSNYFNGAVTYKIDELFEVNYGLSEQRYRNQLETKGNETIEISFLRMNAIREEDKNIELKSRSGKEKTKTVKEGDVESDDKKINIPEKFLLNKEDLLINTRGTPKLISMSGIALENNVRYVANHNFITLRPRKNLLEKLAISEAFLIAMLRNIVENVFKKNYEEQELIIKEELEKNIRQKIPKRSVAASISSVKIDEVKNEKIIVPQNPEAQKSVFTAIDKLEELKKIIDSKITLWNTEIFNQINETH